MNVERLGGEQQFRERCILDELTYSFWLHHAVASKAFPNGLAESTCVGAPCTFSFHVCVDQTFRALIANSGVTGPHRSPISSHMHASEYISRGQEFLGTKTHLVSLIALILRCSFCKEVFFVFVCLRARTKLYFHFCVVEESAWKAKWRANFSTTQLNDVGAQCPAFQQQLALG